MICSRPFFASFTQSGRATRTLIVVPFTTGEEQLRAEKLAAYAGGRKAYRMHH